MKHFIPCSFLLILFILACKSPSNQSQPIFDGKTFAGWSGDTIRTWRIENGMLVGGSLDRMVPHNDFLCTERSYDDFVLTLKIK